MAYLRNLVLNQCTWNMFNLIVATTQPNRTKSKTKSSDPVSILRPIQTKTTPTRAKPTRTLDNRKLSFAKQIYL